MTPDERREVLDFMGDDYKRVFAAALVSYMRDGHEPRRAIELASVMTMNASLALHALLKERNP